MEGLRIFGLIGLLFLCSCSTEDDTVIEDETVTEYKILISETCEIDDNEVIAEYCVTEQTYDRVIQEMFLNFERDKCEKITFTDINDNQITEYVGSGSKGTTKKSLSDCY